MIRLHADVYSQEYGFDHIFESYVGEYKSRFFRCQNEREKIWIVEENREILGCITIVRNSEEEAQLRWYLLHPRIRGSGLGKYLLDEAIHFARANGYRSIFLLTESVLERAAKLYEQAGFTLTREQRERKWGKGLIRQRYDLILHLPHDRTDHHLEDL
ncbi:MAG: GNAT family N-acetyltransferase [Candidatus Thermoplasmatota archaeon]|nr:GNAT family N-acetyltransferase [Candidatus Thermoplasmatota archaeon]